MSSASEPSSTHSFERVARPSNGFVVACLKEAALLLAAQGAGQSRVAPYHVAAGAVEGLGRDLAGLFEALGEQGLDRLPGIGHGLGAALAEMLRTGRWRRLDRLRGGGDPVAILRRVPGIGPVLAEELVEDLHLTTLEALEADLQAGRLDSLPHFNLRRRAIIAAGLAQTLGPPPPAGASRLQEPPVGMLLDADAAYRRRAAAGDLPRITPRRFNPRHRASLPILHSEDGRWAFTATFSHGSRARRLGRTADWVSIVHHFEEGPEGQRMVVTETHGPLRGRRVVRGREAECLRHYEGRPLASA